MTRKISTDEERLLYRVRSRVEMAHAALGRLLAQAMKAPMVGDLSERARISIPRREDDDDSILEDVLEALPILLERAAAEPEAKACVFCKHVEPHTKDEGRCEHLRHGCTVPGCECGAYETVRP
jgi:hypothetical protein